MAARALLVLPHLRDRVPTRFALDFAAELPGAGVSAEVFCIAPGDPRYPEAVLDRGPLVPIVFGSPPWWRRSYRLPAMVARLARAAARTDVVLAASGSGVALAAALLAGKISRKPVLVIAHGSPRPAQRWIYPRFDAVVQVTPGTQPSQYTGVIEDLLERHTG